MRQRVSRGTRTLSFCVTAATLALAGCAGPLADAIVEAPNGRGYAIAPATVDQFETALGGTTEAIETDAGTLSVLRDPAAPFDVTLSARVVDADNDGPRAGTVAWSFKSRDAAACDVPARGTVVLLHGFSMSKETMGLTAALLADAGFDVVLVDLPGHGESGGDYVTFGVREAPAVNELRVRLEADGAAGPYVLLGVSLGGTIAIRAAALDDRWDAVIAQQPFDDPAALVPNFRQLAPRWLRWYASPKRLERALVLAEERAGFRFDDARLSPLLAGYRVPTLIEHGGGDRLVPPAQSAAIADAAPDVIERAVDGGDHFTLSMQVWRRCPNIMRWLEATLATTGLQAACERIQYDDPDDILEEMLGADR